MSTLQKDIQRLEMDLDTTVREKVLQAKPQGCFPPMEEHLSSNFRPKFNFLNITVSKFWKQETSVPVLYIIYCVWIGEFENGDESNASKIWSKQGKRRDWTTSRLRKTGISLSLIFDLCVLVLGVHLVFLAESQVTQKLDELQKQMTKSEKELRDNYRQQVSSWFKYRGILFIPWKKDNYI